MKASVGNDTKKNILDIAERHFAIFGFSGTSLRGIIKEAKVNVASVAYHFGSKEELFLAVIERFAAPVVQSQLEALSKLMMTPEVKIEDVLRTFYEPPITLVKGLGQEGETLSLFLGRAQMEPEPVYSLVDKNFSTCRNEYIKAFRQLIPGCQIADYQWDFEFMLSLIVCFLTRRNLIERRYNAGDSWDPDEAVERLTICCSAMLRRTR